METTVSLRSLQKGQHATIAAITADGEMGRRIRDMGLVPGVELQVIGRAPLEDPVALRLMGFTLTLRNNEADYVSVKNVKGADAAPGDKEPHSPKLGGK